MYILIGLIPALAWGVLPIIVTKVGGKPSSQIVGTTIGTFLVSLVVWLFVRPAVTTPQFIFSMLSGASWAVAQFLQYTAFKRLSVSRAMPISTGLQLVGTSLLGVLVFGEWAGSARLITGFSALAIIIVGVIFTTIDSSTDADKQSQSNPWITVAIFAVSTLGFVGYSAFPRLANVSGWQGFLPQGLGMAIMALILAVFADGPQIFRVRETWLNLIGGFVFSIAALTYLISAAHNGVATGFTLSQMNVVVSTLGGILILHERRSRKGLIWTLIGLALVVTGGVMTGMMS